MPRPAAAARKMVASFHVSARPEKTVTILERIISEEGWAEGSDSPLETAEKWHSSFKIQLRKIYSAGIEDREFVPFVFNLVNDDYIQGNCYVEPGDSEEIVLAKRSRANVSRYLEHFHNISPSEFEIMSGSILTVLGVIDSTATIYSSDQGIDFYGQVPFGEIILPSAIEMGAQKNLKIWMVGQAKHYNATQVSTKEIRELVGSVKFARAKVYAGSNDPLFNLNMRVCDPVFYLFFTTGRISRDARELLKRSGVVALNGTQIATLLADSRIGLVDGEFDEENFRSWYS